jgi:hypothetical protein
VEPALAGDLTGRSALATVRHLLRLIRIRIEQEGGLLSDDIDRLARLLTEAGEYFATLPDGGGAVARQVADAQAHAERPPGYESLDQIGARAKVLREALYQALTQLQQIRAERKDDPAYVALRDAIRAYLVAENADERKMMEPAFYMKGPRR